MATHQTQPIQKVHLSLNLRTSPPHTLPIHDASPTEPLKLIATVSQITSPFPDRAVTLLTKYTCLDAKDAFFVRALQSPKLTPPNPNCPTPELRMHAKSRITTTRISGHPDLLQRDTSSPFTFLTIPPPGKGDTEVTWELSPEQLLRRLGNKDERVESKLHRLLRPGDAYKIQPGNLYIYWWSFGDLEDEGGRRKKVARWSLPDDLPLDREEGVDETEEVAWKLVDLVDLHKVNWLSARSAVEGEKVPVIKTMRSEGWIFGEPESGLVMVYDQDEEAVFTVTE